jgi:hypothetical protein
VKAGGCQQQRVLESTVLGLHQTQRDPQGTGGRHEIPISSFADRFPVPTDFLLHVPVIGKLCLNPVEFSDPIGQEQGEGQLDQVSKK